MTREEINQAKQKEIENEESRQKRKKVVLTGFKITFLIILFFFIFYFYTTYISTGSLIVNERRIINSKIPDSFNGFKIIQFSDLHYGPNNIGNQMKQIVKDINDRNPDIVVFTGDLIDNRSELTSDEQEVLIKYLKKIKPSLGKYAVPGNEDGSNFTTIMNQSEFTVLNNSYDLIYKNDNNPILLVGADSLLKDRLDVNKAYEYYNDPTHNSNIYTITLMHEPDSYDTLSEKFKSDLYLAGHSHNGTVRIPFIGALKKVEGAQNYTDPYYKLDNSKMYISSGIGTYDPGFRLFCKPSINFFRLSNK